jgi:hypothetical protein
VNTGIAGTERRLLLGGVALLAVLGLGLGAWLLPVGGSERRPAAASSGEVRGLRAELIDREAAKPGGGFAWTTTWRLCWAPIPGARGYLLTMVTSEGVDPRPRATAKTCYSLTVASGTAARRGARRGRPGQLAVMESMLSVSVAARLRDGSVGPAAPDVAVGRTYP